MEYLIADGQSQAKNKIHISYNGTNIPGHTINWSFRFWTLDTLGEDFFDLTSEEQESVLNTTTPDYEGTGASPYGSITSSSITNSSGIASSIYTAGTVAGIIEIKAGDAHINPIWRGSWITDKIFLFFQGPEKEKLELRIWRDSSLPEGMESHLKTRFVSDIIPAGRYEWVQNQLENCKDNEFNLVYSAATQPAGLLGWYKGNSNVEIRWEAIQEQYPNDEQLFKRTGYIIAHEMAHSYTAWHHNNCLMVANPGDLPESCDKFCEGCKGIWWKILGGH